LGAVSLLHYTVTRTSFTERPHGLLLSKGGTIRHWLAAESTESVELWHSVFNHASKAAVQVRHNGQETNKTTTTLNVYMMFKENEGSDNKNAIGDTHCIYLSCLYVTTTTTQKKEEDKHFLNHHENVCLCLFFCLV
jgi:hypothetical protein